MPKGVPKKGKETLAEPVKDQGVLPRGVVPRPDELATMKEMVQVFIDSGFISDRFSDPKKALAVVLKGWEMGVPPLQALEGFYVSEEGRLSMQADLMRSLVQKSGAGIIMVDSTTNDGAVVVAIRYGVGGRPDRESRFSFTMDDATRAGLAGSTNWRKYPASLCLARATSQAARTIFPDVLMGVSYTPEEIGTVEAKPTPTPVREEPDKVPYAEDDKKKLEPEPKNLDATAPTVDDGTTAIKMAVLDRDVQGKSAPVGQEPPAAVKQEHPRPLVHTFMAEAPGGGVRPIQTAGVTKDQLKTILDITTARAGRPNWQELQQQARAFMAQLGLNDLRYLTEAEGAQLMAQLLGEKQEQEHPHRAKLRAVLSEAGLAERFADIEKLIALQYSVDSIEAISTPQLAQALGEVKDLCRDKDAFVLMVDRSLMQMGGQA